MAIKREELDRREVDLSDVVSGQRLPPVHPGQILRDDYLIPMGLSVYRLAQELRIPRPRLNDVVLGRRGVTVDTALRLGYYFGTTPEFWINLLRPRRGRTVRRQIEQEIKPYAALRSRDPAVRQPDAPGRRSIEQIGMGSGPHQDEGIVLLIPDQQSRVRCDLPSRRPVPG